MSTVPMSEVDIRFNLIAGNWWINSCGEYWKILHVEWPRAKFEEAIELRKVLLTVAMPKGVFTLEAWYFMGLIQTADANGNYPVLRT